MKSSIFFFIILMTITSLVFAQSNELDNRESFRLGIKAGLNRSYVFAESGENLVTEGKYGFAGGVLFSVPISKYLGVQPEVLISQKGFTATGTNLGNNYNLKRTTTYMDIPLLLALKPSEFITILAGPQYSYLIKQKDNFDASQSSFNTEENFSKDVLRKNIFGFVVGVDLNFGHFILGARSGWDLQNNNTQNNSDSPIYKNAWLQGTIAFVI